MPEVWLGAAPTEEAGRAGLRFGHRGTHTSRTMMLAELSALMAGVPAHAPGSSYGEAIREDNLLAKKTAATRGLTYQRLRELYALDARVPVFHLLRWLWGAAEGDRPRLALLVALGRDPLLRATAPYVLGLQGGELLERAMLQEAIGEAVGDRLNPSIADKVARNAASSWTQSGHLGGHHRKTRLAVDPSPAAVAFAVWLAMLWPISGNLVLESPWLTVFDGSRSDVMASMLEAKRIGLLAVSMGGGVLQVDAGPLMARAGGGVP